MVFFNFSAQEDQTFKTNYSPRLRWPPGDVEFEVLLRGQHIFVPRVCFWGAGAIRPLVNRTEAGTSRLLWYPWPAADAARFWEAITFARIQYAWQVQVNLRGCLFEAPPYSIIGCL